ncbi:MAG: endonuclease YncB(thermonuclease family) [Motiliproteus sp.]|jgi:endonuclease YncB( thermonuclease family)
MQFFSKALSSAFVFFSLSILSAPVFSADLLASACPPPANPQSVASRYVYDGDTLQLEDGRKIRLIGINTPELGRDGQSDQPLAQQATAATRRLLEKQQQGQKQGQQPLLLQLGSQPQDHYGRTLGHIFLADGRSLAAELLRQGLGFALSIPPNLALRDCLRQAEQAARLANLGVWAEPYYRPQHASSLNSLSGGFGRYTGEISRAGTTAKGNYLELNGKIFIPIRTGTPTGLDRFSSDALLGRRIEVRGWLIAIKPRKNNQQRKFMAFRLTIKHADNLSLCDPDC